MFDFSGLLPKIILYKPCPDNYKHEKKIDQKGRYIFNWRYAKHGAIHIYLLR